MSGELFRKSARELSSLLTKGEVSSVEVTRTHLDRIAAVDGKLRAFTVVWRDEALASAQRADEERSRGEARGPLHGLPVSIKECLDVAGQATTLGLHSRRDRKAPRDAALVELLRGAGAVLLGRTNISQTMMFQEARNPIFGQTANPFSLAHTPGGSSGGEGAAIASGCSPLGIGTDIGGSVRVPAAFSGVCGLKPTLDRWPMRGSQTMMPGQEVVRGMAGPLARTTADLTLLMTAFSPAKQAALDPRTPPLPVEDPASHDVRGARVGWYVEDGFVKTSTAIARGVERARAALLARGCELVPFTPPLFEEATLGYFAALSADGGHVLRNAVAGGPVDPVIAGLMRIGRLPQAARTGIAWLLERRGELAAAKLLRVVREKSVPELQEITIALRRVRAVLLDAMDDQRIDFLLCPAFATPAVPHGLTRDFVVAGAHSMLFNTVQFPAGVVPVGTVRANEILRPGARGRLETRAAEVDRQSAGLPIAVQLVARPWQESRLLAIMSALEAEVRRDPEYPITPHDV